MSIPQDIQVTIERCAEASHAGTLDFPNLLAKLVAVGVESYFADYRQGRTLYYLSSGECLSLGLSVPIMPVTSQFDTEAIRAAVRSAQLRQIQYPEFIQRTMAAGCVGYFVWILERQVHYLGRRGDTLIDAFPAHP